MIRFILNSLLLLFFFGIVTASKDFDVVMDNKEFKTTNSLIAVYSQHVSHPSEGYHKAEFILNTNFPSFNPDQSGVKSVICKTGANGKRKITFRLKDKKAVGHVNEWPEKIMLLISHKWKCFGERSTQFFTATDRVINESKLVVTFDIEESDFPHNSDYELNINWVHGNQTNNNTHHLNQEEKFHFPHIPKPHLPHLPKPHLPHLPKPHLPHFPKPFPTINKSNKLDLDVLFDSKTGKTSKPDIKIISNKVMELLCANCFTTGDATVTLRIAGNLVPPKVKEASISLNGNFHINLDFALESTAKASNNHRENSLAKGIILISFGLSPLSIPGILTLGPAIDLVADADVSTGTTGIIGFGGDLTLPNFNVQASFGGNPSFTQSGFTPTVNAHTPKASIEASASISASLKPQLSFGMIVFKGRVLKQTVGFEFVETLENLFTFGTGGCKNKPLPHLESDLDSSIGFFVDNRDFPIFKTTKPLLDKCL